MIEVIEMTLWIVSLNFGELEQEIPLLEFK